MDWSKKGGHMNSLAIREARENIINYTNSLPFPLEVKRLIFCEILSQIDSACTQEIAGQIEERKKEQEQEVEEVEQSV